MASFCNPTCAMKIHMMKRTPSAIVAIFAMQILISALQAVAEIALPSSGQPDTVTSTNSTDTDRPVKTNEPLRISLQLLDGSTVIGEPQIEEIPFKTSFGEFKVKLTLLDQLSFTSDHQTATVVLQNGDRIEGTTNLKQFDVKTLFGKIAVPISSIGTLTALSAEHTGLLSRGCVLYFSFDKDEDGKVTDKSGKNNHGVAHNAKWVADGKKGGAYSFDGKNDFISVAHAESLNMTTGLTVIAWIKTDEPADGDGWDLILCKGDDEDRNYAIGRVNGTRALSYTAWGGQGHWSLQSRTDVCDGKWHSIATTWNGSEVILYVDGVDDTDQEYKGNYGQKWSNKLVTNSKPLLIGTSGKRYPFSFFNGGLIDEVMVFDHALSGSEIRQIHNSLK
jgi:hypothetical protein